MYIFGASGHGKVVKSILESQGIEITAFVDDNPQSDVFMGLPTLLIDNLSDISNQTFLIAVGDNLIRKALTERLKCRFIKTIHSTACVDKTVVIDEGTVVMPQAVINADTEVGKHVIINSGAVVEHDCYLEDYVHISPNATLTGNISVGEGTQIGAGAVILPGVKIGRWCMVGAGAVVLKDVPDYAVVVGNPAKVIKFLNNVQ